MDVTSVADTLIAVGVPTVGAVALARVLKRPRRPGAAVPEDRQAVCQCGHGFQDHHPQTRACHARVETYKGYRDVYDSPRKRLDGYTECTCQQYTGPDPLPSVVALD